MEGFIYVIALIWSILSLILFFKIWGMTNDVETINLKSATIIQYTIKGRFMSR